MSAQVLIRGTLFRSAEQRTSKSGKPFVTATLRCREGEATEWWKVLLFSESAQAELLRLQDGDALAAQGALRVETYDRDGETKISLTIIADQVLALRQPPKPRKEKAAANPDMRTPEERCRGVADLDLNDSIPF